MPSVIFNLTMLETCPPEALASEWPRIAQAANRQTGDFYLRELLPPRFKPGNRWTYGFQPRTPTYDSRKLRLSAIGLVKEGGMADLVFRGTMRQRLLASGTVAADPHGAVVSMVGTGYTGIQRPGSPDKKLEIALIVDSEMKPIAEVQSRVVQEKLDQLHAPKTTGS